MKTILFTLPLGLLVLNFIDINQVLASTGLLFLLILTTAIGYINMKEGKV